MMVQYALIAGMLGSTGGLFGKLGVSNIENHLILSIISLGLMLFLNTSSMTMWSKAAQHSGSSLTPTVITTATNYLFSALLAFIIFGETTTLLWWCGTITVLTGLFLIVIDNTAPKIDAKKMT